MTRVYIFERETERLLASIVVKFEDWQDDVDRLAHIGETVTIWASDNGFSYDDLHWERY